MANDYIEVLFINLKINEISKIISSIDYNVDDITNCYYFFLSNNGNTKLSISQLVKFVNQHYNINIMFERILLFGIGVERVQLIIRYIESCYDLTLSFEKEFFDNEINKKAMLNSICSYSEKEKDVHIYIGHEPVEDDDMRNLVICNGKIFYVNTEGGYWRV